MRTTEQMLLAGPAYATALVSAVGVAALATTGPIEGEGVAVAAAVLDARWALHQFAKPATGIRHHKNDDASSESTLYRAKASRASTLHAGVAAHREAWHTFYTSGGFLTLPHPRLEQFYWVTQYKMGCGMGLRGDLEGDGGVMDHTAPWFLPNNGLFNWDLNIQV